MNFENPIWLYITPAIVFIAAGIIALGLRRRESLLGKFAAPRLLGQLTEKASHTRTLVKAACLIIGLAALGIALARPQYGVEWSERKARGLDIVFVLDSSKSMLATDIRPTRLDRAKLAVIDLLERLESDRIGLVAFAGRAFLQTPPTLDYSAFRESLEAVGPSSMTSGGSDLGNAIKEAEKAFPVDNNFKVIILLTDGEDLGGNAIETAKAAAKNGIKVYAIGIGTPEGEYLRIRNKQGEDEFIRDNEGQPVRSQLDEATLQQIAQLTGGTYSRLSSQSLESLYSSVIATLPREEREAEMQETAIERFQWAIGAALTFLVLEILIRRRGNPRIHAALFAVALLPALPTPSEAQETDTAEIVEEAVSLPDDPRVAYNQANEALAAGDFDQAITLYQSSLANSNDRRLERDALYNLAHAKNQSGRQAYAAGDAQKALEDIKEAEALFESIQEIDPNDTAVNQDIEAIKPAREFLEKLKEQQEQEQEQNTDSDEDQKSEEQSSEEDQQSEDSDQGEQSEDGDQQEQESQDSEQQDGEQGDQSSDSESQQSNSQNGEENADDSQSSPSESGEATDEQTSSANPAEDMEQQEAQSGEDQASAGDEATDGEQEQAPQPSEGDESNEASGQATGTMPPIEGMSQEDAAALLESLRGGEKLLPFVEQGTPRNRNKLRDW